MNPNDIVKFRSDFTVELYHLEGSDGRIRRIAKVSTNGDIELPKDDSPEVLRKFLSFLMRNQHGSPFEHNLLTFRIEAPIFLWREFHRHRIGFSCNEQSGRYMQLLPHFYVPSDERRLHSNKPAGFKPSSPSYTQLGVGPTEGFSIKDEKSVWTDFIKDGLKLEAVKSYVYLKVKLLFDPPLSSAVIESTNRVISELEWRINVMIDPVEPEEEVY